jgi:hypothetical protein
MSSIVGVSGAPECACAFWVYSGGARLPSAQRRATGVSGATAARAKAVRIPLMEFYTANLLFSYWTERCFWDLRTGDVQNGPLNPGFGDMHLRKHPILRWGNYSGYFKKCYVLGTPPSTIWRIDAGEAGR